MYNVHDVIRDVERKKERKKEKKKERHLRQCTYKQNWLINY